EEYKLVSDNVGILLGGPTPYSTYYNEFTE
ncbi:hypothetical protein TNCV_705091, partial [Trichonephila clavipes]